MARTFPLLPAPSVFIAAPGDVEYLREAAIREFEALVEDVADDHGLHVYNWVYDKAEEGFKDWLPAQQQIPLPSDPLCRAVICLLGERIGTPLSVDVSTAPLGPLEDVTAGGFRLVHPWEPAAADHGGFPLTGTVFECLVALRANQEDGARVAGDRGQEGDPPLLLLLVGDESVVEETDPLDANWGMRRLKKRMEAHLEQKEGRRAPKAQNAWFNDTYAPQLKQLSNFVRYLQARRGFFPCFFPEEEAAREEVRAFLRSALDLRIRDARRDPFKGLEPYERDDVGVFYGRETERRRAVRKLDRLWKDKHAPTFFGVIGGSGSGKSSFARAGLVAHLCHGTSEGRYVACVLVPNDLLRSASGHPSLDDGDDPLLAVFLRALQEINPSADQERASRELQRTIAERRPELVLEQLVEALARKGEGWRLLLAFDQFEELLDQYASPQGKQVLAPVVALILLAARHPATGVIYTLQTNREELISEDPMLGPLWSNGDRESLAFPTVGLEEIIRRPFRSAADVEVEPRLVKELLQRVTQFAQGVSGDSQGSLLPLISLTLKRIWDTRGAQVLAREAGTGKTMPADSHGADQASPADDRYSSLGAGGEGSASSAQGAGGTVGDERTLRLEDCADLLDIGSAIAQLGDEAVDEARANAGASWDDDAIGDLARRLVRFAGGSLDRLLLPFAGLPRRGPTRRLAEALIRRRLVLWEPGNRVRLVHEAVVHHWAPATKWLAAERSRLHLVSILGHRARTWSEASRQGLAPARISETDVDEAADVLANWSGVLSESGTTDSGGADEADTLLLRDYALAVLLARPAPMRVIEPSSRKPLHVHLACHYGATALLDRYLVVEPDCVLGRRSDQRTPLFDGCFAGRLDVVDKLLAHGAAPAQADVDGWQPVHAAASNGHTAIVERLVAVGVSPATRGGPWQSTPLHLAVANGHAELSARLLAFDECDPSAHTRSGWTPLHMAAQEGQVALIRLLAATGRVSVDATTENDWTPLHAAANYGHADSICALLELGAKPDARAKNDWAPDEVRDKRPADKRWENLDWTPLHLAVTAGSEAAVRVLREGGADPDAMNDASHTPLTLAISAGKAGLLRTLLSSGRPADLKRRDARGRTALHQALSDDRFELAHLLVEAGADVNLVTGGSSLLATAVAAQNESRVVFLLQHGADPHAAQDDGRTPLHLACSRGNLTLVRRLLEAGADPNHADAAGRTALHRAATSGIPAAIDVVAWLVKQPGVDVARGDHDGMTALHAAISKGSDEAAAALIEHGEALDARDADGWTPLLLAAHTGRLDPASRLLAAGGRTVDVDAASERPALTAIQAAAEGGHVEVIAQLLQAGADPNRRTTDKPPALDLAVRNCQFDAAHGLLDRGAVTDDANPLLASLVATCQSKIQSGLAVPEAAKALARRLHDAAMSRGIAHYPFEALPPEPAGALLRAIHPVDGKWAVDATNSRCEQVRLPWYQDVVLFRVTDPRWPRARLALYYLGIPAGGTRRSLHRLNGSSDPIHEVNRILPPSIDETTALGYLKFFCFFVRGDQGMFYLYESPDDPLIPREIGGELRSRLSNPESPARFDGREDDGSYRYSAVVWYGTKMFASSFKVHPTGNVDMVGDEPIGGDLSGSLDAPIA